MTQPAREPKVVKGTPTVAAIYRHPVKSLRGEVVTAPMVTADGLDGDRVWGIQDMATGRILTARREPTLLLAAAMLHDGCAVIELPNGEVHRPRASDRCGAVELARPLGSARRCHR